MDKFTDSSKFFVKLGKYSFWVALIGMVCWMMLFPTGIYYGFFCGVMAVAAAIMSKRAKPSGITTLAIVVGMVDIVICLFAFYGIYSIYVSVSDPVMGPIITEVITDILTQNGISLETFSMLMAR